MRLFESGVGSKPVLISACTLVSHTSRTLYVVAILLPAIPSHKYSKELYFSSIYVHIIFIDQHSGYKKSVDVGLVNGCYPTLVFI